MPTDRSERFAFLDALRGLAALAVLVSHILKRTSPQLRWFVDRQFELGHAGVIVFFLISGWVIPLSLERGNLREFWVRRVCRLYPLYWVMVGATLAVLLVPHLLDPWWDSLTEVNDARLALARAPGAFVTHNVLMTQSVAGWPHVNILAWTLTVEMVFYLTASFALACGALERPGPIVIGLLGLAVLVRNAWWLMVPEYLHDLLLDLAIMWSGSVLYGLHAGHVSLRSAQVAFGATSLVVVGLCLSAVTGSNPVIASVSLARLSAFGVFLVGLSLRACSFPAVVLWLGRISYSIYLMHSLVLMTIRPLGHPLASAAVWLGATLLVASLTYRFIETPGIHLGRWLSRFRGVVPAHDGHRDPSGVGVSTPAPR